MSLDYSEKRGHYRMGTDAQARILRLDTRQRLEGRCHNLSATGMLLSTAEAVPAGTALQVNITPEKQLVPPLEAEVEVLRVEAREDGRYHLACTIRSMGG